MLPYFKSSFENNKIYAPFPHQNSLPANSTILTPQVKEKMEIFREKTCHEEITSETMLEFIDAGEKLAYQIEQGNPSITHTAKDACSLVWFMMAMCASTGEEHYSGTIRIDDKQSKLYDYLFQCESYPRISSHYKAHRDYTKELKGKKQRGIDISEFVLPNNKHTILFSKLRDGTTFVKLENYGMPPFWKPHYRNKNSLIQVAGHLKNYFKHIIGLKASHPDYKSRRENFPKDYKKKYLQIVKTLDDHKSSAANETKPSKLESMISKSRGLLTKRKTEKKKELTYDRVLLHLNKILDKQRSNISIPISKRTIRQEKDLKIAKELHDILFKQILEDKLKGYQGGRQGKEVVLPSFSHHFSKYKF